VPPTVRHNMGTVGEHIALSCAVDWVCEYSREKGPVRYVDTHGMAPLNIPIGSDFPKLVTDLSDQFRDQEATQAPDSLRTYFDSIRRATIHLRDNGINAWYPTHFLHAWAAARARCARFEGYIFENDDEGAGRRQLLSKFLPVANFLLAPDGFNATLAPAPGDFRNARAWPSAAPRPGCGLVLMNDPLQMERNRQDDPYMDPTDLNFLASELNDRYLDRPALTVCVIFCFSNPGTAERYQHLTDLIASTWNRSFAPQGQSASAGIKWGSFMFFVGAANTGAVWDKPTLAKAFAMLERNIRACFNLVHGSEVTLFRAK